MSVSSPPSPPEPTRTWAEAGRAFRAFFEEMRAVFVEREALFTQLELALLCREHLLIVGPPGTAKSAIASSALGRIVEAATGAPSLFARQLSESTVQTDLLGPVDFKVLTETGRTEYLTDEGMLSARFVFLDEIFDGREMLLRSLLNALHERELKHGRQVTRGQVDAVVLTSNRYLSEVLERSEELMLAFADRIAFISFVPKSFIRESSRRSVLERAAREREPLLTGVLALEDLEVLQRAVAAVEVPSLVMEGLELLADGLERALQPEARQPGEYVATKYFSQRSLVKALWALKAGVVRDALYRHPNRLLRATLVDLEATRAFFVLGGPSLLDAEALAGSTPDPRERRQLETLVREHRAFDSMLSRVEEEAGQCAEREALRLLPADDVRAARELGTQFDAAQAGALGKALREKLRSGPKHLENRRLLVTASELFVSAVESHALLCPVAVLLDALDLCTEVAELHPRQASVASAAARAWTQGLERLARTAESLLFEPALGWELLLTSARECAEELAESESMLVRLSPSGDLFEQVRGARLQVDEALRRAVRRLAGAASLKSIEEDAQRLTELERWLAPGGEGLHAALLAPRARSALAEELARGAPAQLEDAVSFLQDWSSALERSRVDPRSVLEACRELIDERLRLLLPLRVAGAPQQGLDYAGYRALAASRGLGRWSGAAAALQQVFPLSSTLRRAFLEAEHGTLHARLAYLGSWLAELERPVAEPFDVLVRSRFPQLVLKEGELVQLRAAALASERSDLLAEIDELERRFAEVSQRALARA